MPEQLQLLQQMEEMEQFKYYNQLDAKEQQCIDEEEQHTQAWKIITPDEHTKAILAEGSSEAKAAQQRSLPTYVNPSMTQAGDTAKDPILIQSTQSSALNPTPIHVPISHLVPDHRCNPIPSLVRRPNPPQTNALPTIGGPSYTNQAAH
jgi:hypothetical protein